MNKRLNIIAWILQGLCVILLVISLGSKIMSLDKEIQAFARMEMEPLGRYTATLVELLCVIGLLTPRLYRQGAVLAVLVFASGVLFQLFELGINWWNDGGLRFYMNVLGLLAAIGTLVIRNRLAEILYRRGRLD